MNLLYQNERETLVVPFIDLFQKEKIRQKLLRFKVLAGSGEMHLQMTINRQLEQKDRVMGVAVDDRVFAITLVVDALGQQKNDIPYYR